MRFALIGDHPDGLALALALQQTGRHELARYAGPTRGADWLNDRGLVLAVHSDLDEVLADPTLDLFVVADELEHRPEVLKRAVRAERHVLCVHPADTLPDITYEAAMVQQETRQVLLPILPMRLNPGLIQLRELNQSGALGAAQTLEGEFHLAPAAPSRPPLPAQRPKKHRPPGNWDRSPLVVLWEPLRFLAGEVREVSALGVDGETLQPGDPLSVTGRFANGLIFQVLLSPSQAMAASKLTLRGSKGEACLTIDRVGSEDSAQATVLQWQIGEEHGSETWNWNPWPATVENFERFIGGQASPISWLDATRCLELFEAVRQSVKRRRVIPMQYEEFSEAAGFKTVMTALGCLTLVLVPVILVVLLITGAPLAPWSLYLLLPLLLLFLLLQALGWIVPRENPRRTS